MENLKLKIKDNVELQREQLIQLSLNIHNNPELAFKEEKASAWLTGYLQEHGFRIVRGITGLATAFQASYGQGRPAIAVLAEYDALPKLGHACGHNIIGVSAVAAAVASKCVIDQLGGSVVVVGTPAEEGLGGKIEMVRAGAFNDLDVAMMIHPNGLNMATIEALACSTLDVEFFGRPAHAASQPHKGINALEAMVLAFTSIDSLRQHIRRDARIHGIITDGGEAPNIVPAHSAAEFLVRASDNEYLAELRDKVLNCFRGASVASGARLEYRWRDKTYAPMKNNVTMAQLFSRNLESLGRQVVPFDSSSGFGSTDMGNVSQVVPSMHPTAMAMTVADILQPGKLDRIRQEFCSG
jgi:amidohydrolase